MPRGVSLLALGGKPLEQFPVETGVALQFIASHFTQSKVGNLYKFVPVRDTQPYKLTQSNVYRLVSAQLNLRELARVLDRTGPDFWLCMHVRHH